MEHTDGEQNYEFGTSYRSAHFACRIGLGHFPSARAIQEFVQGWRQMRKWRYLEVECRLRRTLRAEGSPMRRFIQRYHQRLSYFAALIVFLTFISKEALHDHWVGLAESIERTEDTLSIRQDIDRLHNDIRRVEKVNNAIAQDVTAQKLERQVERIPKRTKAEKELDRVFAELMENSFQDEANTISTGIGSGRKKLEIAANLVAQLPDREQDEKARTALGNEITNFANRCFLGATEKDVPHCLEDLDSLNKKVDTISEWCS